MGNNNIIRKHKHSKTVVKSHHTTSKNIYKPISRKVRKHSKEKLRLCPEEDITTVQL